MLFLLPKPGPHSHSSSEPRVTPGSTIHLAGITDVWGYLKGEVGFPDDQSVIASAGLRAV